MKFSVGIWSPVVARNLNSPSPSSYVPSRKFNTADWLFKFQVALTLSGTSRIRTSTCLRSEVLMPVASSMTVHILSSLSPRFSWNEPGFAISQFPSAVVGMPSISMCATVVPMAASTVISSISLDAV